MVRDQAGRRFHHVFFCFVSFTTSAVFGLRTCGKELGSMFLLSVVWKSGMDDQESTSQQRWFLM